VGDAGEALLHAVLLERPHAGIERDREHLGDARLLGDQLLERVGRDQKLVQAAAALKAAAAALVAADRLVHDQLALLVAVVLHPLAIDAFHRRLRVLLEGGGLLELVAILLQEGLDLGAVRVVRRLAGAHAPREALRQDPQQRVGEV
jgi:hypothetical protein